MKEDRLRLEIVGMGHDDLFERAGVVAKTFLCIRLGILEIGGEPVDPEFLTGVGFVLSLDRLVDEFFPAGVVFEIRHRHAPVGHRAIGIDRGDLPEAPLRLEEPVTVELADALIEKSLSFLRRRRHLEIDLARPRDEHRRLTRSFVEHFAVVGMTREGIGLRRLVLCCEGADEEEREEKCRGFHGGSFQPIRAA